MAGRSRHSELREPLRWHWLYIPLIAYVAFSVGPSVLAPILFVLSFFVDIPVQRLSDPISLVVSAIFLGLTLWPFLWLYGYARDALIANPSAENSLRLATIMSTVAMSLPSSLLSLSTVGAMLSSAHDAYQGWGIAIIFFFVLLPLPGLVGWLIGRGIAWILWP
jgi:hypothetical protein